MGLARRHRAPQRPRGGITASTGLLAFSSRVVLDGEATLHGARLSIEGSLHAVDLERLEREQRQGFDGELRPQGAPVAGSRVTATIVERWEARIRTGRAYDFITKKAFDTYRYDSREKRLGSRRATTDASGRFVLDVPVPSAGHDYVVTLAAADADGRQTSLETWARTEQAVEPQYGPAVPSLHLERPTGRSGTSRRTQDTRWAIRSRRPCAPTAGPSCRPGATIATSSSRPVRACSRPGLRRRPPSRARSRTPTSRASRSVRPGSTARPGASPMGWPGAAEGRSRSWRPGSTRPRDPSRCSSRPTRPATGRERP